MERTHLEKDTYETEHWENDNYEKETNLKDDEPGKEQTEKGQI